MKHEQEVLAITPKTKSLFTPDAEVLLAEGSGHRQSEAQHLLG